MMYRLGLGLTVTEPSTNRLAESLLPDDYGGLFTISFNLRLLGNIGWREDFSGGTYSETSPWAQSIYALEDKIWHQVSRNFVDFNWLFFSLPCKFTLNIVRFFFINPSPYCLVEWEKGVSESIKLWACKIIYKLRTTKKGGLHSS